MIIAGAGATRSDAVDMPYEMSPPLDADFFSEVNEITRNDGSPRYSIGAIRRYMQDKYAVDILGDGDSLERVMSVIYSDALMPAASHEAESAFWSLFRVLNQRIADTTNSLTLPDGGNIGRIMGGFLREVREPGDITVITFNHDLQIEKAANALQKTDAVTARHGSVFNFPYCYKLPSGFTTTAPVSKNVAFFEEGNPERDGLSILKLHGSLNWYSEHTSPSPTLYQGLLKKNRKLVVTHSTHIGTKTVQKRRKVHTLPVVVPPVGHKVGMFHTALADIWVNARQSLQEADEIVIFGYSCPEQDMESENLIRGSLLKNDKLERVSVIDPSSAAIKRYADLMEEGDKPEDSRRCLHFYRNAGVFMEKHFST